MEILPVWKKEFGADDKKWVEGEFKPKPGEYQIGDVHHWTFFVRFARFSAENNRNEEILISALTPFAHVLRTAYTDGCSGTR